VNFELLVAWKKQKVKSEKNIVSSRWDFMIYFAKDIHEIRERTKLSQNVFAKVLNVSSSSVK